jgi:hypothetical protein
MGQQCETSGLAGSGGLSGDWESQGWDEEHFSSLDPAERYHSSGKNRGTIRRSQIELTEEKKLLLSRIINRMLSVLVAVERVTLGLGFSRLLSGKKKAQFDSRS